MESPFIDTQEILTGGVDGNSDPEGNPFLFTDPDTGNTFLRPWALGGGGGGKGKQESQEDGEYDSSIPCTSTTLVKDPETGEWIPVSKKRRVKRRTYDKKPKRRDQQDTRW